MASRHMGSQSVVSQGRVDDEKWVRRRKKRGHTHIIYTVPASLGVVLNLLTFIPFLFCRRLKWVAYTTLVSGVCRDNASHIPLVCLLVVDICLSLLLLVPIYNFVSNKWVHSPSLSQWYLRSLCRPPPSPLPGSCRLSFSPFLPPISYIPIVERVEERVKEREHTYGMHCNLHVDGPRERESHWWTRGITGRVEITEGHTMIWHAVCGLHRICSCRCVRWYWWWSLHSIDIS